MTKERRDAAIRYIMLCLEDGYLDLGLHDQDELTVVKEAMKQLIWMIETCRNIWGEEFATDESI